MNMARTNCNIDDLVKSFVKIKLKEEEKFIEELEKDKIQIYNKVSMKQSDQVNIVAELSVNDRLTSDNFEHTKGNNDGSFQSDSNFQITSVTVSTYQRHNTKITTVVSKKGGEVEGVYESRLVQQQSGSKLAYHQSFTRPVIKSPLPSLGYSASVNKTDTLNRDNSTQLDTKLKKTSSSIGRSSSKKKSHTKTIENSTIASSSSSQGKKEKESTKLKIIDLKGSMPFKVSEIGQSSNFLNIMSKNKTRSNSISQSKTKLKSTTAIAVKKSDVTPSTKSAKITTISKAEEPEIFHAIVDKHNEESSDCESIFSGELDPSCEMKDLNIEISIKSQIVTSNHLKSCPNIACSCENGSIELLSEFLMKIIKKEDTIKIKKKLESFNKETRHFIDCPSGATVAKEAWNDSNSSTVAKEAWHDSHATLHRHCADCHPSDLHISRSMCQSVESLVQEFNGKEESEVLLDSTQMNYFMNVGSYKKFKSNILKVLGLNPTPFNFARLLYMTRSIVRHIGNPENDDNDQSNRIYTFVARFYRDHFYPHIQRFHENLNDFLFDCQCNNFAAVD